MRLLLGPLAALLMTPMAMASEFPYGSWDVESIDGTATTVAQSIAFDQNGGISGEGGCNGFRGMYEASGASLDLMNVMSTQRACPDLEAEGDFFAALSEVSAWRQDDAELVLLDANGEDLIVLREGSR